MVGFQGESPADRRALEGAVAKAGSVASRSSREFRDSRDVQAMFKSFKRERERGRASSFKLSVFGHRPQAAGPIKASVRGGAPPMSKLSGVDVHVIQYFIHSVEDTNLQILYACLVTHDAKA